MLAIWPGSILTFGPISGLEEGSDSRVDDFWATSPTFHENTICWRAVFRHKGHRSYFTYLFIIHLLAYLILSIPNVFITATPIIRCSSLEYCSIQLVKIQQQRRVWIKYGLSRDTPLGTGSRPGHSQYITAHQHTSGSHFT